MYNKKLITALVVLIFIMGATKAIGKRVDPVTPERILSDSPILDAEKQASIVLSQNDKGNPEESNKSESGSQTGESDATAEDQEKSSDTESKPLRPFVPSEQIAGEQAVDFPADI